MYLRSYTLHLLHVLYQSLCTRHDLLLLSVDNTNSKLWLMPVRVCCVCAVCRILHVTPTTVATVATSARPLRNVSTASAQKRQSLAARQERSQAIRVTSPTQSPSALEGQCLTSTMMRTSYLIGECTRGWHVGHTACNTCQACVNYTSELLGHVFQFGRPCQVVQGNDEMQCTV